MNRTEGPFLSAEEEKLLLRIARDSLETYVRRGDCLDVDAYPLTPRLSERHGAFVTLRRGHELRGCIGYTQGIEPLATTVRDNTINAAARDPRFPPVAQNELPEITIEISALCPGDRPDSPFIEVGNVNEIVLGRDGLYLEHRGPRGGGLLLPQVPIEQDWTLEEYLEGICRKAGAPPRAWELPDVKLYRFSAHIFGEKR
ncbi:MAG: AmmeMemoRadiSam system protein A [Candidatus Hydrogenedentes bacterium]|nr:AmmeMemoRadiSam system protein A [Candidatus Hydrogenedentota bacterium]